MTSERIYRRATLDDKEDVLAISDNIYNGRDYLPELYDDVIYDNDKQGYVCEEKGKLLGFFFAHIVDNSETIVRRAGRVKPSHQGQGIFRNLMENMMSDCASLPNVKSTSISVGGIPTKQVLNYLKRENYRHVQTMNFHLYKFNIREIPTISCENNALLIQEITSNILTDILKNQTSRDYLFPDDVVRIHSVPFKPIKANIKSFVNKRTYIIGSFNKYKGEEEVDISDLDLCNIRLMTLASFYTCKDGLAYQLDIFGNRTEDLGDHLYYHMQKIKTMANSHVTSGVMTPSDMEFGDVEKHFKPYKQISFWETHIFTKTL
ncbi:histidine N-acetyltransferase-like [Patella vulgata]|uniref:histidine N-acetyltransferase-like n=1 Tax=Patella vulgata TaxID=6465 RepID=UPI0024A87E96|nr:histidine N-acetyltransferase-like [Patella vulgata]